MAGRRRVRRAVLHGQVLTYEDDVRPGALVVLIHGVGSEPRDLGSGPARASVSRRPCADRRPARGTGSRPRAAATTAWARWPARFATSSDHLGLRPSRAGRPLARRRRGDAVRLPVPGALRRLCARRPAAAWGRRPMRCCGPPRCPAPAGDPLALASEDVSAIGRVGRTLGWAHIGPGLLSADSMTILAGLHDPQARAAFLATLRGVVDISGQRVSATSRLPDARVPVLLIWGDRDPVIPIRHGHAAVDLLTDGRLVVFPGPGTSRTATTRPGSPRSLSSTWTGSASAPRDLSRSMLRWYHRSMRLSPCAP